VCQANNETPGFGCTTDGNDCTNDVCGAGGLCTHPNQPVNFACGSPANTDCDNANTCNGSGVCQANNETPGFGCTTDGNDCTNDVCGAGGLCTHPNQPAAFACGSPANTDCDNANTCNGSGVCQANNETDGTSCNEGDVCTSPDTCQGGQCSAGPLVGCKVTGGGQLNKVSFGFNVQTGSGTKGQLEFNRHTTPKATYHSIQIGDPTPLMITSITDCNGTGLPGQEATFTGTIRRKGQADPCDFTAVVKDCGEPGRNDTFSIDIAGNGLCPESRSGTLDRGNIQVH